MLTFSPERMPDPLDLLQTLLIGYNELTTSLPSLVEHRDRESAPMEGYFRVNMSGNKETEAKVLGPSRRKTEVLLKLKKAKQARKEWRASVFQDFQFQDFQGSICA